MGNLKFVDEMINKKLLDLHCAYIGEVKWTDGDTATVQPLGLIRERGSNASKTHAVVSNVPVACKYKISSSTITYTDADGNKKSQQVAVPKLITTGDKVVCICADRDITDARRGMNELPPTGMHNITDSIIVGIL